MRNPVSSVTQSVTLPASPAELVVRVGARLYPRAAALTAALRTRLAIELPRLRPNVFERDFERHLALAFTLAHKYLQAPDETARLLELIGSELARARVIEPFELPRLGVAAMAAIVAIDDHGTSEEYAAYTALLGDMRRHVARGLVHTLALRGLQHRAPVRAA